MSMERTRHGRMQILFALGPSQQGPAEQNSAKRLSRHQGDEIIRSKASPWAETADLDSIGVGREIEPCLFSCISRSGEPAFQARWTASASYVVRESTLCPLVSSRAGQSDR